MNKNPAQLLLLFLIAGACIVVAVVCFLWNDSRTGDVREDAPQAWLEDELENAGPFDSRVISTFDDEIDAFDDPAPAEVVRIELPTPKEFRKLVVQVMDGKSGGPAAEADVYYLDGFGGPELRDPFAQHWSDLAESRGKRFKTDSQGRIELPPVREWAIVTAKRPGAYGFARVGQDHRDVETVSLETDETVTVRVVDGKNRPVAQVPVGVLQHVPLQEDEAELLTQLKEIEGARAKIQAYIRNNPGQREAAQGWLKGLREKEAILRNPNRGDKTKKKRRQALSKNKKKRQPQNTAHPELRARRRTGDDGIAVFRHFQVYRHEHEAWWPLQQIDQFEAVLLVPLLQPESQTFAGRPVPMKTLELRMPPFGSIAMRTVDHDGRPFLHQVHAELRMDAPEFPAWTRLKIRKEQDEKEIVFPFVGLGLLFNADCRLVDSDFSWYLPTFYGPINPGDRLTLDLLVAPDAGMLSGRLLDEAGRPLAGARPTFLINSLAGRLEGEEVPLDTAGRFHLPYKLQEPHVAPYRLEIRRNESLPPAGLAMALPDLQEGRVTDLGDLRINAFERIAHGTVVDDRDTPIEGASVQLQRERETGGKTPQPTFVDEAFTVCLSDAEGRFELYGDLENGRYRLRAQARDHFPAESSELGRDRPIDLKLQRRSKVVGTVLTPPWMPSRSVRVRLESAADPKQRRDDQVHDYMGKTYIYFDWVKPGIYNVLIRLQDFPDPFLRIDGLEVLPGELEVHPRLQDIDLRSYLFHFEVIAVDGRGRPIQPKRPLLAQIMRQDGQTGYVGFPWRNGRAEVFSITPELEVWPEARGYHAEPTVLIHGESELRFLKIPPVEVHVPGLRQVVGAMPVWIGMTRAVSSGTPRGLEKWDRRSGRIAAWYVKGRSSYAALAEGEIARVPLSRSGLYQVVAYVGGRKVRLDFGSAEVNLKPGAKPQRVKVTFDAEQVRAAIGGAGK